MSAVPTYIHEADDAHMPDGARIQWRHFDVLSAVVGQSAIAAAKATDFRERAFYQHREQTLDDVLRLLISSLPKERGEGEPEPCPGCTEYNERPTKHAPPLCPVEAELPEAP